MLREKFTLSQRRPVDSALCTIELAKEFSNRQHGLSKSDAQAEEYL